MNQIPETAENAGHFPTRQLDGEKIIEQGTNSVIVEFSVPGTNPYFDGHFPGFPILPAIAQIELVIRYASRFFETGIDISEIPRIKFTNLIRPSAPLALKLERKDKTISFKMYSPGDESVYSAGTLKIRENNVLKESL